MFQWLLFNLLLEILLVSGQTCQDVGVVSARLEPTQQTFSFAVHLEIGNPLHSFEFLQATNTEMDLHGPIYENMIWWNCAAQLFPEPLHSSFGVKGCIVEDQDCSQSFFAGVEWSQIQEGRMFWFLLEPTDNSNEYTLTTSMNITYGDTPNNQNVTFTDQFVTDLNTNELGELGIDIPTMDVRVTSYEIGAVNTEGNALLLLQMELYLSDEQMWALSPDKLLTVESEETALNADQAVITKGNDDRTWQAVLSVSVCDLSGPATLTIKKPVLDQSVEYVVSSVLEIDMQSACPNFSPIGDLPTTSTSKVYSDSGYTTEATDFFLGDTVYVCSTLSSDYNTLASASFDSLSITQSTTTDLTSQTSEISTSVVSTGIIEICISFPLPETLTATPLGTASTVSATYSLTYTDPSTGRRLLSTDFLDSELSIRIRSSSCVYPNGKVARQGDLHSIPCENGFGYETRKCQHHQWEMVEECGLSFISHLSSLQTSLCVFSVLTACYFSSSLFSGKLGKD